ncbi:MAG TPA: hypothetical protein PKW90_25690 [Myxococcota bacterium]|nr:hypothetical protein [Myxococcota bacterium]
MLIVPQAHTRIFDYPFQEELYDVFHQGWLARLGHFFSTPVILLGCMVLGQSLFSFGGPLVGLGVVGLNLGAHRLLGALVLLPTLALCALSYWISAQLGVVGPAVGLAMMFLASCTQALSHLGEEVPPPWSGSERWAPVSRVFGEASREKHIALFLLGTGSILLEFWASFRVFGLQMYRLGLHLGWRPGEWQRLQRRRAEILDNYRSCWPVSS